MRPLAYFLFFLSGVAAVLYQVIWQRLLVLFTGADVHSVIIIVAAFMAGLGLGNLAGGRLADRLGSRGSLWAFAAAELAIGVFGLFSTRLYYDGLYTRLPHLGASPVAATLALFASLLVPTFLMGVSLPLLARALTVRIGSAGRIIGSLYGWNTLGAAAGAFVATWLLIPRIGFAGALVWGAAANLLCGAGAIMIGRQTAAAAGARHDEPDGPPVRPTAPTLPFPVWVAVFGLTGLIALGLEIAWFRLLGVLLKSTAFTFGTLLAVYLAGLGAGGAVGARVVHRTNRPGRTFLLLQFAMIWYAGLSVTALVIAIAGGYPARLVAYLGSYEPFDVSGAILSLTSVSLADPATIAQPLDFVLLYGAIPVLVVGPPTFLMGFSFPFLQRACQSDLHTLGRRVGTLLSANICGGVLGTALTGWILLPWLGTAAALKVLVALGLLLAWPLWRLAPAGRLVPAAAVALTLLAVTAMPNGPELWARLHASPPGTIIAAEDGSGLSVLKPSASGATTEVFINGLGQSEIPYGGIQTVLGALPALLHPAPQRIVIVGLGSGNTVFAAAARPETTRVTCVEIVGAQWTTLRAHDRAQPYAGLTRLLTDARIQPVTDDGRAYLLRSGPEFDIIEMDALRPTSAYAGNLNSREYFDLVGRRLRPGGLAVTWAPTRRSRDTFLSVFPHALRFTDILIGSHDPIPFDAGVLEGRALAARDYYLVAGIDILALVGPYLAAAPERVGPDTPRRLTDLNTDLFPRDEFSLP